MDCEEVAEGNYGETCVVEWELERELAAIALGLVFTIATIMLTFRMGFRYLADC